MKKGEVFFHPMEGSGQLSITWSSSPKGAAVEAKKGNGVGFFSSDGILLSVLFDDVSEADDHQVLEFKNYKIEISVKEGIVKHKITQIIVSKIRRSSKKNTISTIKNHRSKVKR